jgi:hypothetical protein
MEKRRITKESLTNDLQRQHFFKEEIGHAMVYTKDNCSIQIVIKGNDLSIEDEKGEQIFTTRFDEDK